MESTDQQQQAPAPAPAALDALPPSAKLALLHAQASSSSNNASSLDAAAPSDNTIVREEEQVVVVEQEEEAIVPSAQDPVVFDNAAFAEPIIAGDIPVPIGQHSPATPAPAKPKQQPKEKLDLSSETAFPSLSAPGSTPRPPALSAWSSSSASRVKASQPIATTPRPGRAKGSAGSTTAAAAPITDVLELPANQQIANLPNKPLGFKGNADVIQQVMSKTGTNIIASTNRSGTTTFLIQGAPAEVARAKRELVAGLAIKRTVEISVPASTRRFIIGAKGKTLQQIEAKSGVRINFPPRKEDEEVKTNGDVVAEDESIKVTLVGDAVGIGIAKAEIDKIVSEKAAKQTIKVDTIDSKYYLLLAGAHNKDLKPIEQELNVKIQMPPITGDGANAPILVTGDKEKVQQAKQALEERYKHLQSKCRTAAISVPKRQHKYLVGKDGSVLTQILEESGCTVELPPLDDPSDNLTVRGPEDRVLVGLQLVLEKAREVHVQVHDLAEDHKTAADPVQHGKIVFKYLSSKGRFSTIANGHNVDLGVPDRVATLTTSVPVEFVSKTKEDAVAACKVSQDASRALTPERIATVDIAPHLHRHIAVRHARPLQRLKSRHNVEILFPDEKDEGEIPTVAIIYEGKESESAEQKAEAAKAALEATIAELNKLVADSADFISKTVAIPSEYHAAISGPRGTTLNAILGGSETAVTVRFGGSNKDAVNVRGPSDEVNRALAEITKVFNAAKSGELAESFSEEFTIPAAYSAHVIGKSGANINKLKEEYGVKIDISDAASSSSDEFKTASNKKGSKASQQRVKVVIQGVQYNVQVAKERILALVANLADQVTLTIYVPKAYHRYLIGPNGRYVRKLEDKYNVFVKFPRSGSSEKEEEAITIRGRKKDTASAKDELLELYEYEKEQQAKRKEREAQRTKDKKADQKSS